MCMTAQVALEREQRLHSKSQVKCKVNSEMQCYVYKYSVHVAKDCRSSPKSAKMWVQRSHEAVHERSERKTSIKKKKSNQRL